MTKQNWVRDLHHGGFNVEREENILFLSGLNLCCVEVSQGADAHERPVDYFSRQHGNVFFEHLGGAILCHELNGDGAVCPNHHGFFAAVEVSCFHMGHVGARVGAPLTHGVGMLLGVLFDGGGHPPVGVTLPQHRINGAAQHLGVASFNGGLGLIFRLRRIVGHLVALGLQLCDRSGELGNRGADIWQLNNVGVGGLG